MPNPKSPLNSDISALIQQMTLAEKAALVTGETSWTTPAVDRLGIPRMLVSDGPHGVRRIADLNDMAAQSFPATAFPTAACLASTWDVDLLGQVGVALGEESVTLGVDVLLGPSNNMKRTPLCGRNFEYFSEDPYLSGQMAAAWINGLQSQGVGASLKHFTANNQEYQRFSISAEMDERTLREIYLPAFETAVKNAQPWTIMCAYNRINGVFCSESYALLVDLLKDEWGFEGLVVSDWGAVHDRVASLEGGLDLEMPGPKPRRTQAVIDAVSAGELDEAVLDEAVRRVVRVALLAAQTPKNDPVTNPAGMDFDAAAHHALARKVAAEGMVLLKNDGILPLGGSHSAPMSIAVIGRSAKHAHFQGGGSSFINPTKIGHPWDALTAGAKYARFTYAEGYPTDDSQRPDLIQEAVAQAQVAEVALLFVALPGFIESEGYDRAYMDLTQQQIALIKAVTAVQPNTVVILNNGSPVAVADWIDGAAAVLEAWMMGQAGGGAIADILYGRINPAGRLAESFPVKLADTPAYLNFPGEGGQVRYGEGLYIGYRYYDAKQMAVQFPFGHGLSYTTFAYSHPQASAQTFRDVDGVTVSVDVTNTGERAGRETVQVYVHDRVAGLVRPVKELKGFAKVDLEPGETQTVSVHLDFRAFAFWHPGHHAWVTEDGEFDILIGASATDIRATVPVILTSTQALPSLLHAESTLREWLADPVGRQVVDPFFQMIQGGGLLGGREKEIEKEGEEPSIGMDMLGFLMDMTLLGILSFQENQLPAAPAEMVAGMLAQVHGA